MHREGWFAACDGQRQYYQSWLPANPSALVVGVHGIGNHSGYFSELSEYLNRNHIALTAPDLRGFGRNPGERGDVGNFTLYYRDLEAFSRQVAAPEGLPVYLCGESMGGLIALWTAYRCQELYRGMVLLSPALRNRVQLPPGLRWKVRAAALFRPREQFSLGRAFNGQDTSRDPQRQREIAEDPWIVKAISARLYRQLIKNLERSLLPAPTLTLPFLILQAGKDRLLDPQGARLLYQRAQSQDKELRILEDHYHALLTDLGREAVFQAMAEWIGKRMES